MEVKKIACGSLFLVSLLGVSSNANSKVTIDQLNYNTSFSDGINTNEIKQQEVTAGVKGKLTGFDFMFSRVTNYGINSPKFDFFVNLGTGWQTDPHDFVKSYDLTSYPRGAGDTWFHIDTSSDNIFLNEGEKFIIGMKSNTSGGGLWISGSYYNDQYKKGLYYTLDPAFDTKYGLYNNGQADLNFRTYMEPSPAPIPGAIWLLGSGAVGIIGFTRKRKHN